MKKLILALVLLSAALTLGAQTSPANGNFYHFAFIDTLNASESLTFQHTDRRTGRALDIPGDFGYSFIVRSDSISGATGGTVTIQVSNSSASVSAANAIWATIGSTHTIDGATAQIFLSEGVVRARRIRVLITAPGGTQVTALKVQGALKRL